MLKAKKSLGQNWLVNEKIVEEIVAAAKIKRGEMVLEAGPGGGVLTSALLTTGAKVIAIEKDDRLEAVLMDKFGAEIESGQLKLIHGDVLKFDPILINKSYKIVANLPYYLTGEFIRKFLTAQAKPSAMTLMLQKEVAERIVARDGKESVLSISVKAYGQPRLVKTVKRGNFRPVPKVDSAIVIIEHISANNFKHCDEKKFFQTLKAGFGSKRKKLKNNLKLEGEMLALYGDKRAEDLQLADWLKLCANR
ncbi:MAG: ribosomal RNA small subunit methyltransferase A [Candidatus Vogelbacteria bacterium GWA1_51_14]|uniref:Ribosomal RNA small subunit methyltransferase A n=1 Tax=Candidatus Vogelbacteria bacterium GWA1_51_14 TaxID=1802435 RepID=A0A1G2QA52_9BACT|nr:MAG: ribosomal RNA small subunit methyltransferase A [Candidatus Vogelbacteria bacterium GWA1_51_14]